MTIITKDDTEFSAKINKAARKKRFPLHAMFELTYRCNFRCIHCYITEEQKMARKEKELKTKDIFSILEQLRDLGGFYLGFTGGEIFCRNDLLDILWFAKRLGFELILLTNGFFIDEHIAEELKRLRPNKIDITVHSMDKEIFEEITQTPGSHEKTFNSIRQLHARNIPLCIKSCGMMENKNEIIKISQFARELKANFRLDGGLQPRLDGSKTPLDHSIPIEDTFSLRQTCSPKMYANLEKQKKARKKLKLERDYSRLFNCEAGYNDLTINPYGELKICIDIDLYKYKILEGSLKEGWQGLKDFVDNQKSPIDWPCRTCDLSEYCSWCPGKSYLKDGSFSSCDPFSRAEAEFIKKMESG